MLAVSERDTMLHIIQWLGWHDKVWARRLDEYAYASEGLDLGLLVRTEPSGLS